MSGLYHRALEYIQAQRQLRIVRSDEIEDETLNISPDDREKIYAQINEEVDRNRRDISPDTFDNFHPKKRGGILPLMLNLIALMLIAGGGYWLLQYFDRSEATIVTNRAGIQSAEGKLLERLKEESEQQLSEKEAAITDIQSQLEDMSREREQLEANAEAEIQQREAELRAALEEQLATERARLREQGVSETDIESRISAFEAAQTAEFEQTLASVRAESAAEIERQKQTLDRLSNEFQEALANAQQDKTALEEEMVRQEASLLAEFQQKEAALENDRLAALQQLETIRAQQERERLVLDQILSFYDSVRTNLADSDLDGASAQLSQLKAYLNQNDVITLQGVQRRRPVEMFLIGSLEDLIKEQRDAESPDTVTLIRSAEMVAVATSFVEQGNLEYRDADYADAQTLYISALAEIPALEVGYQRLQEIEERVAAEKDTEIGAIIANANTAYINSEYNRAVALYGDALELLPPVADQGDQILNQLTEAGFQLKRQPDIQQINELQTLVARQSADLERLAALQTELTALQQKSDTDVQELARLRAELESLNSQLAAADQQLQELRNDADVTAVELARIPVLEARIEQLTGENQGLGRISELEAKIQELEAAINLDTADAQAANTQLRTDLASSEATATELESQNAALTTSLEASTSLSAQRLERITFLESEIARLETEAEEDARTILSMDDLLAEIERLSVFEIQAQRIPGLEETISTLSDDLSAALNTNAGLEDRVGSLSTELSTAKEIQSTLQTTNQDLAEKVDNLRTFEAGLAEREALLSEIASLRTKYLNNVFAETIEDPLVVLEHLEAKLLIKRIVDSEPVKSQYPGLYDKIEQYIEALMQEQQVSTSVTTISAINQVIDDVIADGAENVIIPESFADAQIKDEILGLIDRLKNLLE